MAVSDIARSQSFIGLNGAQNSILELHENPGYTISEDRAQINVASVGTDVGGNTVVFRPSAINFLFTGKAQLDQDYYRSYDPHSRSFWASAELMGPGASFRIKKRYFFAITTGIRYLMNSDNLDPAVYNMLGINPVADTAKNDSFKIHNYSIAAQVFKEYNLSYAGYIYQSEDYNLVGGVTVKILAGMGAAGMGISDASFKTHNNDGVAYNATGTVNLAFTPYANNWAITKNPLESYYDRTNNLGVGVDLGIVYYINPNDAMTLKKGYALRLAASITDIGSLSYTASSTSGTYGVNNKTIDYRGIANNKDLTFGNQIFNTYLVDTIAVPKGTASKFKVHLPTAFHLNADLKVERGFAVNANLLLNLVKPSAGEYSNHYTSTLTITPRYMVGKVGLGLPFSFNALHQGYVGAVIFLGPVYLGSGSVYELSTSNSINNINLYGGVTWRIQAKRQKEKDYMMMR